MLLVVVLFPHAVYSQSPSFFGKSCDRPSTSYTQRLGRRKPTASIQIRSHCQNNYSTLNAIDQTITMNTLAFQHLSAVHPSVVFIHELPGMVGTGIVEKYFNTPILNGNLFVFYFKVSEARHCSALKVGAIPRNTSLKQHRRKRKGESISETAWRGYARDDLKTNANIGYSTVFDGGRDQDLCGRSAADDKLYRHFQADFFPFWVTEVACDRHLVRN